jgi:hypothetical protein
MPALLSLALTLLLTGYLLTGLLLYLQRNPLYTLDAVLSPGSFSSALGFVSTLWGVYGKTGQDWDGLTIAAAVVSATLAVCYGAAAVRVARRVQVVRDRGEQSVEGEVDEAERVRRRLLGLLGIGCSCGKVEGGAGWRIGVVDAERVRREEVVDEGGLGLPPALRRPEVEMRAVVRDLRSESWNLPV